MFNYFCSILKRRFGQAEQASYENVQRSVAKLVALGTPRNVGEVEKIAARLEVSRLFFVLSCVATSVDASTARKIKNEVFCS